MPCTLRPSGNVFSTTLLGTDSLSGLSLAGALSVQLIEVLFIRLPVSPLSLRSEHPLMDLVYFGACVVLSVLDLAELARQHLGLIVRLLPAGLASALVLAHDHRLGLAVQVPVGRGSLRHAEVKPTLCLILGVGLGGGGAEGVELVVWPHTRGL